MAQSSTARRLDEPLPAELKRNRPAFGGGEPPAPPVRPNTPIGSNAWVAVLMFLGAEAMFFAGLIGAYIVFRVGSRDLAAAVSAAFAGWGDRGEYVDFACQRGDDALGA